MARPKVTCEMGRKLLGRGGEKKQNKVLFETCLTLILCKLIKKKNGEGTTVAMHFCSGIEEVSTRHPRMFGLVVWGSRGGVVTLFW